MQVRVVVLSQLGVGFGCDEILVDNDPIVVLSLVWKIVNHRGTGVEGKEVAVVVLAVWGGVIAKDGQGALFVVVTEEGGAVEGGVDVGGGGGQCWGGRSGPVAQDPIQSFVQGGAGGEVVVLVGVWGAGRGRTCCVRGGGEEGCEEEEKEVGGQQHRECRFVVVCYYEQREEEEKIVGAFKGVVRKN